MKKQKENQLKIKIKNRPDFSRRTALKALGTGVAAVGAVTAGRAGFGKTEVPAEYGLMDQFGEFFQQHYKKMSKEEISGVIERIERKYKAKYDLDVKVGDTPPFPGVVFGYALNINKCKGYRECVRGCVEENNQSRDPQIQYIRVLELDRGSLNLEKSEHYYDDQTDVPKDGKMYLPIQCHQCDNPPCVKACPVEATWKEPDGVVVVDYNWCIGCRMCANACPYWARRFNWSEPVIPKDEINPETHYLSNRPREKGVMEKCTFCIQRTRKGELPACHQACPTGARVFGNLLDVNSEIRYVLENKDIFRLKEELNTEPKFWYYTD
ncbi:MAG: 4Fe-4S dicluster domain-containing protein [Deltaproteobacteria bacterium]|nr:4Fe-4S dicluster domain-containing protein [Deltaproteobacteria bacterium]